MENQEINPVSPETNETPNFSMEENENQEIEPTTQPVQEEPVNEQKQAIEAEAVTAETEPTTQPVQEEPVNEQKQAIEAEAVTAETEPTTQPVQEEPVNEQKQAIEAEAVTAEITEPKSVIDLENIMAMIGDISKKFDEKIARDSHKNQLFDKMYAELSSYKNDLYQKMLKPFIMDTIMLIDDTNKLIRDMDKTDTEKVFKVLSGIPNDLQDILERNGIETFEDESDTFNAKTQKVLKTVLTDNPELDKKIESRVRQGYKWDEKVIKPEMIQCYKYSTN